MINYDELKKDLAAVINKHSAENESNTPDFMIAEYLVDCFIAYNRATNTRELWYGRNPVKNDGGRSITIIRNNPNDYIQIKDVFANNIVCKVCGDTFEDNEALYIHYYQNHNNNTTNEC